MNIQQPVKKTHFRWVVAGMIFVLYAIACSDRANIGFAMPFIRKEFEMSNAEAGAILSLFMWGYAIMQIPSGFAMSKFSVRKMMAGSMFLTSICTVFVGLSNSPLGLKLSRFGLGLAEGPLPIGISTTINNWFAPNEKGTVSGLYLAAVKFGPVIVPPICAVLVSIWGWREIFYFFAIPGIIIAIVWFVLVPSTPSESKFVSHAELDRINQEQIKAVNSNTGIAEEKSFGLLDKLIRVRKPNVVRTKKGVFASWNIWGCALGYAFQLSISNVLLAWIPTYLITVKKFSIMGTGLVASAPWIGAVIGNIVGGWISDRVFKKRRKPGMLFSALATAGMMYALINSPADPTLYALLLLATGICLSIGFSAYMAYPMGIATKKTFPLAVSLVNTGGQIGGAAAPMIVGFLLDSYGWSHVFMALAIGSLISFILVASVDEPIGVVLEDEDMEKAKA